MPRSVLVDTSAVLALISKRDNFHIEARSALRSLRESNNKLLLPRLADVEIKARLARDIRSVPKETRKQMLAHLLKCVDGLRLAIEEHVEADFVAADRWCRDYADWPVGYVDLCIAAAANRLGVDAVWTIDMKDLTPFIRHALPKIDVFRHPPKDIPAR